MDSESAPATVLVVDDEPQVLRLLVRILERAGLRVLEAGDGDGAVEILNERSAEIDVLLLDVVIPPHGARAVIDVLPAAGGGPALVLASGDRLEPELETLLEEHGGVFLRKPFSPTASLAILREILERRGRDV